ncbi:hypothetical protein [Priestia megaterium]|uniref:hypothetical protein n=1 Tax=Priestia megaterium TaxID=1404 RepID=UPI001C43AD96|nr:hypothetical protein [Priestia megaterium]MBV6738448.1 hypothetical protein [Priestia megaterium]
MEKMCMDMMMMACMERMMCEMTNMKMMMDKACDMNMEMNMEMNMDMDQIMSKMHKCNEMMASMMSMKENY